MADHRCSGIIFVFRKDCLYIQVNLGVVDANPCTTQGAISIMRHIQKYMPTKDGNAIKTMVSGDGAVFE